jgi:hypothetical protein
MSAAKNPPEDEGGEFADFMADISQEIAQRVESLEVPTKPKGEPGKEAETKKAAAPDPGVISEWEEVSDRMIEEMR